MKHKQQAQKGYMLIEILVSLSIFTIVAVSSAAALLSIVDANSKAQALKTVMDNLNVAVENMSRTIRIGTDYKCLSSQNDSGSQDDAACGVGMLGISFIPQDSTGPSDRVKYYYALDAANNNVGTIFRERNGTSIAITAPEVKVYSLKFYVLGAGSTAGQARVFININGVASTTAFATTPFNIQTSVSQRQIETN